MKTAKAIYVKFIQEKPSSEDPNSDCTNENVTAEEPPVKKSKSEELRALLTETAKIPVASQGSDAFPEIKRQFCSFEATGKLPPILEEILHALKSIPPSSVEAKRAFSAAGLFLTKLRSRLDDRVINDLCFLQHFFLWKSKY